MLFFIWILHVVFRGKDVWYSGIFFMIYQHDTDIFQQSDVKKKLV